MNQKDRMLGGYPYRSDDKLLSKERMRVRKLIPFLSCMEVFYNLPIIHTFRAFYKIDMHFHY